MDSVGQRHNLAQMSVHIGNQLPSEEHVKEDQLCLRPIAKLETIDKPIDELLKFSHCQSSSSRNDASIASDWTRLRYRKQYERKSNTRRGERTQPRRLFGQNHT